MPYQVICPNCSSKLKSGQPVAAGRTLTCPQCKKAFTLTEPATEVDTQPVGVKPPSTSTKSGRTTDAAVPRKGSKADIDDIESADIVDGADFDYDSKPKAKRRRDEDDEDDRPRSRSRRNEDVDDSPRSKSRRDDDEDDRPRSRRSRNEDDEDPPRARKSRAVEEDDEDDRPRSRKGRAPDDEDDRPKSRLRVDDEDEEELPRSRKGRARVDDDEEEDERSKSRKGRAIDDDDEEDDDRPRARKRKGKKGNKTLLVALIGGGAALVFLLCVGLVLIFDPFGFNLFGGGSSEMLAWAPSDSQFVMYMDIEGMEKVNDVKGGAMGEITDSAKLGLKREEVSAVMGAGKSGGLIGPGDPDVTVIKLRSSADKTKLINSSGGKEATVNSKKYYKTSNGGGLYFASDKLLVVTKTEAVMTNLLQKDEGKVVISDDLRSAAKRGDGLFWMASTGEAAEKGDMIGMFAGLANAFNMGKGGNAAQPKCKSTLMSVKSSSSKSTTKIESTYDSSDTARKLGDDLKKMLDQSKNKMNNIDSFDVSSSGATVTLTLVSSSNNSKGGFPGMPFGMGK
jgi:hypothetical protein